MDVLWSCHLHYLFGLFSSLLPDTSRQLCKRTPFLSGRYSRTFLIWETWGLRNMGCHYTVAGVVLTLSLSISFYIYILYMGPHVSRKQIFATWLFFSSLYDIHFPFHVTTLSICSLGHFWEIFSQISCLKYYNTHVVANYQAT